MEEARLTAYLFQKLLDAVFLTKHNMARQLGLSYKALRQVQTAQRMTQKTADAMERLLQYCVRNQIPLDRYLSEYRLCHTPQGGERHGESHRTGRFPDPHAAEGAARLRLCPRFFWKGRNAPLAFRAGELLQQPDSISLRLVLLRRVQ